MNRRFKETLMALAIAAVSASAFAMAPVISFIKSPIIVDDVPATTPNFFVYPDAMNLDSMGSDDTVATGSIIWSYTSAGQPLGQGRYMINGTTALNPALDDPNAPISAKKITSNDDTNATNGADVVGGGIRDGNVRTLTFRDLTLSPLAGPNVASGSPAGTLLASQSITLFASDGTTYSQKTFFAYTAEKGGTFPIDRLSSFAPTVTPVSTVIPQNVTNGGTLGWISATVLGAGTFTATTNNGLCLGSGTTGDNFVEWVSPYKIINLVANSVYRIRITMDNNTTVGIAAGLTPLFDFAIDNFDTNNPGTTENKYSADWINLDNFTTGTVASPNANGVGTTGAGQHVFDIWYAPAPVSATDWNDASNGEFISTHDAFNDMRLQFRVLDLAIAANPNATTATGDAGTLCIRSINVTRIPLSSLHVSANVYDVSTITATTHIVTSVFGTNIVSGAQTANAHTTVDYTGGSLTVSPNTAGTYTDGSAAQTQGGSHAWDIEALTVASGNAVTAATAGGTPADNDDNWPFLWNPGELLMSTVTAVAPNAQSAVNPPDGLQFAFDSPTTEILQSSIILASSNVLGLPKTTPTQYKSFFYTQAGTNQAAAAANHNNRLRVNTAVLLNPSLASGGQPTNTGGIKFTEFKVDRLDLPSN